MGGLIDRKLLVFSYHNNTNECQSDKGSPARSFLKESLFV